MYLEESSIQNILKWLTRELEPICDADPEVLAKYVLALLRHDKNDAELQAHCIEQLQDFLKEETEDFVTSLFKTLEDGKYKENNVNNSERDDEDDIDEEKDNDDRRHGGWRRDRNRDDSDDENDDGDTDRRRDRREDFSDRHKRQRYDDTDNDKSRDEGETKVVRHKVESQIIQSNKPENDRDFKSRDSTVSNRDHYQQQRYDQSDRRRPPFQQNQRGWNNNGNMGGNGRRWGTHQQLGMSIAQPLGGGFNNNMMGMNMGNNMMSRGIGVLPQLPLMNNMTGMSEDMMMYGGGAGGAGTGGGVIPIMYGMGMTMLGNGHDINRHGMMSGGMMNNPFDMMRMSANQMTGVAAATGSGGVLPRSLDIMGGGSGSSGTGNNGTMASGTGDSDRVGFGAGRSMLGSANDTTSSSSQQRPSDPSPAPQPSSQRAPLPPTPLGGTTGPIPPRQPPPIPGGPPPAAKSTGTAVPVVPTQPQPAIPSHYQPYQYVSGFNISTSSPHVEKPSEDISTILCTGIPVYLTESDLRNHFQAFGKIVYIKLQPPNIESVSMRGQNKVYNECIVQFSTTAEAKACFNSPIPVLNNRFIRVNLNRSNIYPLNALPPPLPPLAAATTTTTTSSGYKRPTLDQPRTLAQLQALTNDQDSTKQPAPTTVRDRKSFDSSTSSQSGGGGGGSTVISPQTPVQTSTSTGFTGGFTHQTGSGSGSGFTMQRYPKKSQDLEQLHRGKADKEVAEHAVLQQYGDLRNLRQKSEAIWRQREAALQSLINQYKTMLTKLATSSTESSSSSSSNEKAKISENIEGKLMDLQSQLRSAREQRERGDIAVEGANSERAGGGSRSSSGPRGGRGGRGGGGRYNSGFPGGSLRGRGGRGGRGRGRIGNATLDNRPRTLVIPSPPAGLAHVAESHFSRFGQVMSVQMTEDGLEVEFVSRRHAEMAKLQGTSYEGQILTINWQERQRQQQLGTASVAVEEEEEEVHLVGEEEEEVNQVPGANVGSSNRQEEDEDDDNNGVQQGIAGGVGELVDAISEHPLLSLDTTTTTTTVP